MSAYDCEKLGDSARNGEYISPRLSVRYIRVMRCRKKHVRKTSRCHEFVVTVTVFVSCHIVTRHPCESTSGVSLLIELVCLDA